MSQDQHGEARILSLSAAARKGARTRRAMAEAKAKRQTNVLRVNDYGDDALNRLALALAALGQMQPNEREAALAFIGNRYKPKDEQHA